MAILKVAQLGHPVLRQKAGAVDEELLAAPSFRALLNDLSETMQEYRGVGLAAPQIREPLRAFVMEVLPSDDHPERSPLARTAVVNPHIEPLTDEVEYDWEGCLSLQGLRGLVPRLRAIRLRGLNDAGEELDLELEGFAARVAQHETDHLDGVVYLDRMPDLLSLANDEELQRAQATPASEVTQCR